MGSLYDRQGLLERMGGNERIVHRLVERFRSTVPSLLSELSAAVESRDRQKLEVVAHTYKGSVANFGADPLVKLAESLEENPDFDNAGHQVQLLEKLTQQILAEMASTESR
jgi:HPt (histidine-containing phosphotransfer) domain-containing protein